MTANFIVGTSDKLGFISSTLHIVQPDGAISLAKEGKRDGSCSWERKENFMQSMFADPAYLTYIPGCNCKKCLVETTPKELLQF